MKTLSFYYSRGRALGVVGLMGLFALLGGEAVLADEVFMQGQGQLKGEFVGIVADGAFFTMPGLPSALKLKKEKIKRLVFTPSFGEDKRYPHVLTFTTGDVLPCRLDKCEKEEFVLSVESLGSFKSPLSALKGIRFLTSSKTHKIEGGQSFVFKEERPMPLPPAPSVAAQKKEGKKKGFYPEKSCPSDSKFSEDGWAGTGTPRWKWLATKDGSSLEIPYGLLSIYKKVPDWKSFSLSGQYSMRSSQEMKNRGLLMGFVSSFDSEYSLASAELVLFLNASGVELLSHEKRYGSVSKKETLLSYTLPKKNSKNAYYKFRLESKNHRFELFIDDKKVAESAVQDGKVSAYHYFFIQNYDFGPKVVRDIKLVQEEPLLLSSSFDPQNSLKETPPKSAEEDIWISPEGAFFSGKLKGLDSKTQTLEWISSEGSVSKKVPLELVESLWLATPKQSSPQGSVTLFLQSGGYLTGVLESVEPEVLRLNHPFLGKLSLPRAWVKELRFEQEAKEDTPEGASPSQDSPQEEITERAEDADEQE